MLNKKLEELISFLVGWYWFQVWITQTIQILPLTFIVLFYWQYRHILLKNFTLNYYLYFNNDLFQTVHSWKQTFESFSTTTFNNCSNYYYNILFLIATNWTIIPVSVFGSRLVMHMQTNLLRRVIWSELQHIYWLLIKCMKLWGCSKTTNCTVKLVLLPSAGFLQMTLSLLR